MPISIAAEASPSLLVVSLTGDIRPAEVDACFRAVSDQSANGDPILIDFREARVKATHAEFMGLIDLWFETIGAQRIAAIVYDPVGQTDNIQMFTTKNILMGGKAKSFTQLNDARTWLEEQAC